MAWNYRSSAPYEKSLLGDLNVNTSWETLTAARTITDADNGKTFVLNLAAGFDVTLPSTSAGLTIYFIVGTAPTTAYTITAGTADTMAGSILSSSGAAEDTEGAATGDVLNFVANTALVGDRATVSVYNGKAYVVGVCSAAGGMTITG